MVKRIKYPGTIDQFRNLLQWLTDRHREGLAVAGGQLLSFCEERKRLFHLHSDVTWDPRGVPPDAVEWVEDVTPPSRGTWLIGRLGPDGRPDRWYGRMEAYEGPSGVVVEFSAEGPPPPYSDADASATSVLREFAKRITEEAAYMGDTCDVLQLHATSGESEVPDDSPTPESRIEDVDTMKEYHRIYSVETAREILKAIPIAYREWSRNELDQWGPGAICKHGSINRSAATISRYLGAFERAGIKEVDGIPIPHRFRSQNHKKQ
jgi:hypothetical protein